MSRTSVAALVAAVVFVVVAAVPWESADGGGGGDDGSTGSDPPVAGDEPDPRDEPSDDRDRDDRTIVPEAVPARGSLIRPQGRPATPADAPWEPIGSVGGQPVRWDPCRPVPYVVRRPAGPPNGFEMVQSGLQQISDLSGLEFRFEGFVQELRDDYLAERVGQESVPVWIGWAFDDEVPDLGPATDTRHAIGLAGPTWTGDGQAVGGSVVLRADTTLAHQFGPGRTYGNVLLHELGHLVGLGHSSTQDDQMYPEITDESPDGFGPGDSRGLFELGSSTGCFT